MHDTLTQADAHMLPRSTIERMERERPGGRTKAGAIVRAAKVARMGGPELPPPEKGSFAARVAAAARKARGES
jgi:hypothetical protein